MHPAEVKLPISPELLNQIDVRVGTILSVTDVANSDKLIALEVSFGDHKRTVLAGMKRERANPSERVGLQFRAEFFNLFNRTNFNTPNPVAYSSATGGPSPTAGVITSTSTSSRQVQLGLKLSW